MFAKHKLNAALDEEIAAALAKLSEHRDDPQKYDAALERIANLEGLKSTTSIKPPTMDTVLIVSANLFGILWLAKYEGENNSVIKSPSAFKHVMRLK